jgi:hypothetical protein
MAFPVKVKTNDSITCPKSTPSILDAPTVSPMARIYASTYHIYKERLIFKKMIGIAYRLVAWHVQDLLLPRVANKHLLPILCKYRDIKSLARF